MARVQFVITDEERERCVDQAQRQGMTLSAWLSQAARERLAACEAREALQPRELFKNVEPIEDIDEFFRQCDEIAGPGREMDWEDIKEIINESRISDMPQA